MSVTTATRPNYALGETDRERQRLTSQAELVRPITRRLFVDAGIGPGMRVLDLGCGVGDVSLLLADLVGPMGEVVGIDRDNRSLEAARIRAKGAAHISFLEGDLVDIEFERAFDACVGRFILQHLPDPIATIRAAARSVHPGGIVAFQDTDLSRPVPSVWPESQLAARCADVFGRVVRLAGIEPSMGHLYRPYFLAAGLDEPELRMDAVLGSGPDYPGYHVFAETFRSLLPVMERFGVATVTEFDIDTLADRLRDEIVANDGVFAYAPLAAAWTRTGQIPR